MVESQVLHTPPHKPAPAPTCSNKVPSVSPDTADETLETATHTSRLSTAGTEQEQMADTELQAPEGPEKTGSAVQDEEKDAATVQEGQEPRSSVLASPKIDDKRIISRETLSEDLASSSAKSLVQSQSGPVTDEQPISPQQQADLEYTQNLVEEHQLEPETSTEPGDIAQTDTQESDLLPSGVPLPHSTPERAKEITLQIEPETIPAEKLTDTSDTKPEPILTQPTSTQGDHSMGETEPLLPEKGADSPGPKEEKNLPPQSPTQVESRDTETLSSATVTVSSDLIIQSPHDDTTADKFVDTRPTPEQLAEAQPQTTETLRADTSEQTPSEVPEKLQVDDAIHDQSSRVPRTLPATQSQVPEPLEIAERQPDTCPAKQTESESTEKTQEPSPLTVAADAVPQKPTKEPVVSAKNTPTTTPDTKAPFADTKKDTKIATKKVKKIKKPKAKQTASPDKNLIDEVTKPAAPASTLEATPATISQTLPEVLKQDVKDRKETKHETTVKVTEVTGTQSDQQTTPEIAQFVTAEQPVVEKAEKMFERELVEEPAEADKADAAAIGIQQINLASDESDTKTDTPTIPAEIVDKHDDTREKANGDNQNGEITSSQKILDVSDTLKTDNSEQPLPGDFIIPTSPTRSTRPPLADTQTSQSQEKLTDAGQTSSSAPEIQPGTSTSDGKMMTDATAATDVAHPPKAGVEPTKTPTKKTKKIKRPKSEKTPHDTTVSVEHVVDSIKCMARVESDSAPPSPPEKAKTNIEDKAAVELTSSQELNLPREAPQEDKAPALSVAKMESGESSAPSIGKPSDELGQDEGLPEAKKDSTKPSLQELEVDKAERDALIEKSVKEEKVKHEDEKSGIPEVSAGLGEQQPAPPEKDQSLTETSEKSYGVAVPKHPAEESIISPQKEVTPMKEDAPIPEQDKTETVKLSVLKVEHKVIETKATKKDVAASQEASDIADTMDISIHPMKKENVGKESSKPVKLDQDTSSAAQDKSDALKLSVLQLETKKVDTEAQKTVEKHASLEATVTDKTNAARLTVHKVEKEDIVPKEAAKPDPSLAQTDTDKLSAVKLSVEKEPVVTDVPRDATKSEILSMKSTSDETAKTSLVGQHLEEENVDKEELTRTTVDQPTPHTEEDKSKTMKTSVLPLESKEVKTDASIGDVNEDVTTAPSADGTEPTEMSVHSLQREEVSVESPAKVGQQLSSQGDDAGDTLKLSIHQAENVGISKSQAKSPEEGDAGLTPGLREIAFVSGVRDEADALQQVEPRASSPKEQVTVDMSEKTPERKDATPAQEKKTKTKKVVKKKKKVPEDTLTSSPPKSGTGEVKLPEPETIEAGDDSGVAELTRDEPEQTPDDKLTTDVVEGKRELHPAPADEQPISGEGIDRSLDGKTDVAETAAREAPTAEVVDVRESKDQKPVAPEASTEVTAPKQLDEEPDVKEKSDAEMASITPSLAAESSETEEAPPATKDVLHPPSVELADKSVLSEQISGDAEVPQSTYQKIETDKAQTPKKGKEKIKKIVKKKKKPEDKEPVKVSDSESSTQKVSQEPKLEKDVRVAQTELSPPSEPESKKSDVPLIDVPKDAVSGEATAPDKSLEPELPETESPIVEDTTVSETRKELPDVKLHEEASQPELRSSEDATASEETEALEKEQLNRGTEEASDSISQQPKEDISAPVQDTEVIEEEKAPKASKEQLVSGIRELEQILQQDATAESREQEVSELLLESQEPTQIKKKVKKIKVKKQKETKEATTSVLEPKAVEEPQKTSISDAPAEPPVVREQAGTEEKVKVKKIKIKKVKVKKSGDDGAVTEIKELEETHTEGMVSPTTELSSKPVTKTPIVEMPGEDISPEEIAKAAVVEVASDEDVPRGDDVEEYIVEMPAEEDLPASGSVKVPFIETPSDETPAQESKGIPIPEISVEEKIDEKSPEPQSPTEIKDVAEAPEIPEEDERVRERSDAASEVKVTQAPVGDIRSESVSSKEDKGEVDEKLLEKAQKIESKPQKAPEIKEEEPVEITGAKTLLKKTKKVKKQKDKSAEKVKLSYACCMEPYPILIEVAWSILHVRF